MKKKITQTKWFCDVCGREGSFNGTCDLCGLEYCYVCEFIGYNPYNINICKKHQDDDSMKDNMGKLCKNYHKNKEKIKQSLLEEEKK